MRIQRLVYNRDVVELDIQILIHALQRAPTLDIVLELDRDLLVDQRFEKAISPTSVDV